MSMLNSPDDGALYREVIIADTAVQGLIDSGSAYSFIAQSLVQELGLTPAQAPAITV